jgi:hypothetical protein
MLNAAVASGISCRRMAIRVPPSVSNATGGPDVIAAAIEISRENLAISAEKPAAASRCRNERSSAGSPVRTSAMTRSRYATSAA